MRLYFHFLSFIMQPLNDFNTMFQADESSIGYLQDEMNVLLRKLLEKFVRTKCTQTSQSLTSVPFEDNQNQLQDNIIAIVQQQGPIYWTTRMRSQYLLSGNCSCL